MSYLTFLFNRLLRTVVSKDSRGFMSDLNSLRKLKSAFSFIELLGIWDKLLGAVAYAYV